jgi:hypothetical protein
VSALILLPFLLLAYLLLVVFHSRHWVIHVDSLVLKIHLEILSSIHFSFIFSHRRIWKPVRRRHTVYVSLLATILDRRIVSFFCSRRFL